MRLSLLTFLLFIMVQSVALAVAPVQARARNNAIAELSKTHLGSELLLKTKSLGMNEIIFHCFPTVKTHDYDSYCNRPYFVKDNTPVLNANLISAHPVFNSWMLAMLLNNYLLTKELPSIVKYNLVEFEVYSWAKATEILSSIVTTDDFDYARHPDFDYAKMNDLSSSLYLRLYESDRGAFVERVQDRFEDLNFDEYQRIEDVESRNLTSAERSELNKLKELIRSL